MEVEGWKMKAGSNREAEEKHTLMLSAEGNSGAGDGGRPLSCATICDRRPVFSNFLVFPAINFSSNHFYFVL